MANTLESCTITNPDGKEDECAKFIIEDDTHGFTLSDIMISDKEYTFSFWSKSDTEGLLSTCGVSAVTYTTWTRHEYTFNSTSTDLKIRFRETGTYYIYKPQLEIGNKATDYIAAPEDTDVALQKAVDELSTFGSYIRFEEFEYTVNDTKYSEPCILLGENDTDYRLRITNTRIMFTHGEEILTYIDNNALHTNTIMVDGEIQQGNWVWAERSNGNYGLTWKGVTS